MAPLEVLEYLVVGAFLGAIGQLIRVVVGLKKAMDQAGGQDWSSWFNGNRLLISILISAVVGAIAGILGIVGLIGTPLTTASLVALVTIGYSGTDFIEGFMRSQATPTPAVTLDSTSLDFGSQALNTSSNPQKVRLINTGTAPLWFLATPTGDFGSVSQCAPSIGPGGYCDIQVTFTPTQTGTRGGQLVITDNADGSPHSVRLAGTGERA
jgi:hypothetical protein